MGAHKIADQFSPRVLADFVIGHAATICKKGCDIELAALQELMLDELKPHVPLFYREVLLGEDNTSYIEMQARHPVNVLFVIDK